MVCLFREDRYYRLNRSADPLANNVARARKQISRSLVKHFIDKFTARVKQNVSGVADATQAHLVSYPWPGNIREHENVIERAVLFSDGSELKVLDLPLGSA